MEQKKIKIMDFSLILSIVGIIILCLSHFSCSVDTHKDKYGIKVTYKVPWLPPHGRSVAKLYYKGKLISPNLYYARDKSYLVARQYSIRLEIDLKFEISDL